MPALTLNFEGYAQCRLATDPDPTNERRGVSGYTFALPGEPDLDWILRTSGEPSANDQKKPLRRGPVNRVGNPRAGQLGVKVTGGWAGPAEIEEGHPLYGATVELLDDPRFEERNYIITDQMFGLIYPFRFRIKGKRFAIERRVHVYPGQPIDTPLIDVPINVIRPYTSTGFEANVDACHQVLGQTGGTTDPSAWRARILNKLRTLLPAASSEIERAALEKRISELEFDDPTNRRTSQLVNRATWSVAINGPARVSLGRDDSWLNGEWKGEDWIYRESVRALPPWPCDFWMGSWDADSLTFYWSGTVRIFDLGDGFDRWLART